MNKKEIQRLTDLDVKAAEEERRFQYTEWVGTVATMADTRFLQTDNAATKLIIPEGVAFDFEDGTLVFVGGMGEYATVSDVDDSSKAPKAIEVKIAHVSKPVAGVI